MKRTSLDTLISEYRHASLRGNGSGFCMSFLAWKSST
jgi:hypothetical protein